MVQDFRSSLRSLRHAPGFTLAAVLTFAIGIGATSAIFTVLHAVLLRPLPYAEPDRLVVLLHDGQFPVSPADYLHYRREVRAYEGVSAAQAWSATLSSGDGAERLPGLQVSTDLFRTLGVPAAMGRTFLPGEDLPGRDRVAVLSDALWRRRFGGDRGIVGRAVVLDGEPFTVVGVMPPSFRFAPFWATTATLWRPLSLASRTDDRAGRSLRVFARLRAEVTAEEAQAEASAIAARLAAAYPDSNAQLGISVVPLREKVVSGVRPTLWLLAATVAIVLLIACVNVASLQIVRGTARQKELAVRAALGAGRGRLIWQMLTESLLLSAIGGGLGLLLASWAVAWIGSALPAASLPYDGLGFNRTVAVFAAILILAAGLVAGLAPALQLSRANVQGTLQDGSRGATEGARGREIRRVLLGLELALALSLLAGAGLLGRTLVRLHDVDPGFDPRNLLTFTLSVGGTPHDSARVPYFDRVAEAIAALPGVTTVSAINHLPLAGDRWRFRIQPEGRPEPRPGEEAGATWRVVRSGYFATMRLPLRRGRDFDAGDRAEGLPVCIVNETMARRHWPGEDPIGRRVGVGSPERRWLTVVGVSADARQSEWTGSVPEEIYAPYAQHATGFGSGELTFVVRTARDPLDVASAAHRAARSVDANVPISRTTTMERVIEEQLWRSRVAAFLLGAFAVIALVLAALGVYGVSAYATSRRAREIGIRVALGARPAQVVSLALRETIAPIVAGVAVGCAAALGLGRLAGSLLYGIGPNDPVTFVGAPVALGLIALAAAWIPARRASRIDPAVVLRDG